MNKLLLVCIGCVALSANAFPAEKKSQDNIFTLDPVVVQATRYPDELLNVDSNISVLDEDDIENSNAKYVPDLLREEAGIVVGDFLGNGKTTRVDMRGFGDSAVQNMLVLIDGRRTNQIDLSGADWAQIDMGSIEKVEVIRGAQSVLYGDNATGGVINIITKKGTGSKMKAGYKQEFGSYHYNLERGYIEGGDKFLDYYALAASSYNHGHRLNSSLETVDYSGNITLKPNHDFKLRFSGDYHRDWYGLPGAVTPFHINQIGKEGSVYPDDRAKTENFNLAVTPELRTDIGDTELFFSSDIMVKGRWTSSMNYSSSGNYFTDHHIKTLGFTPKLGFTFPLLSINNKILGGLDYYTNTDKIFSGYESSPDGIIIEKDTAGMYIHDEVEFPIQNLYFEAGGRYEMAFYKFNQESLIAQKNIRKPSEYAYQAGITYRYNDRSSVYLNYNRAFRFPVTDEWYQSLYLDWWSGAVAGGLNLDLKPQVSHNYEIGFRDKSFKFLNFSADYYLMDMKHELYYDSITYKNSCYPHTIHHGLEMEVHMLPEDDLDVFMNYTFQKAFFVGGTFAGNSIPLVPMNKISSGIDYTYRDCFKIKYFNNFVGERYFANDLLNTQPQLKFYLTHNMRLAYKKFGLELFLDVNNITDEAYSEYGALDYSLTRPGYYPSPGRNFKAGVSYEF